MPIKSGRTLSAELAHKADARSKVRASRARGPRDRSAEPAFALDRGLGPAGPSRARHESCASENGYAVPSRLGDCVGSK